MAGCVGFNVHTGQFVVIRARRTIVATGMIAMKGTHRVDNDTGDGVAMAFRAGAHFSLVGTWREPLAMQYLLRKVTHRFGVGVGRGGPRYSNTFGES